MKPLIVIVTVAFSVGLVAETIAAVVALTGGQPVEISTAIELIVAWLAVLAMAIVGAVSWFRGSRTLLGIWVFHRAEEDETPETPQETPETPQETPQETPETPFSGTPNYSAESSSDSETK